MPDRTDETAVAPHRDRVDKLLRLAIIGLIAAVIGAGSLFAYTVWDARRMEKSSTPAQRALEGLAELVRKNPNSAAARVRYGEALAEAGMDKEADEQLKVAVKLDEKHTGAWLDLGLVAMRTGRRSDAEQYFNKVVELTAGSSYENINNRREMAYYYLGEISLDEKRYEDAAGYLKAALRIRKDSSLSYYMLAQALHGLDKDDGAIRELEAALAFDPNFPEAHFLYGTILLGRDDRVNAAVHLVKAAQLAPEVEEAQEALKTLGTAEAAIKQAREHLAAKRYDEAVESALLARTLDDKSVEAVLLHARILVDRGSTKAAKSVLAEAEKLDPGNAEIKKMSAELAR